MNVLNKIKSKATKTTNGQPHSDNQPQTQKEEKANECLEKINQQKRSTKISVQNQKKKYEDKPSKAASQLVSKIRNKKQQVSQNQKQAHGLHQKNQKLDRKEKGAEIKKHSQDNKKYSMRQSKQKIDSLQKHHQSQNQKLETEQASVLGKDVSAEFSDDILSNRSSVARIISISKQFKWTNPQYECEGHNQGKTSIPVNHQIKDSIKQDQVQFSTIQQYSHMLLVKKGYQIGRMSIFEGNLEQKKIDRSSKLKIRIRSPNTSKVSCKTELVPNPESISHLFMKKIVEIGFGEYLVGDNGIIKAVEKTRDRR